MNHLSPEAHRHQLSSKARVLSSLPRPLPLVRSANFTLPRPDKSPLHQHTLHSPSRVITPTWALPMPMTRSDWQIIPRSSHPSIVESPLPGSPGEISVSYTYRVSGLPSPSPKACKGVTFQYSASIIWFLEHGFGYAILVDIPRGIGPWLMFCAMWDTCLLPVELYIAPLGCTEYIFGVYCYLLLIYYFGIRYQSHLYRVLCIDVWVEINRK